MIYKFINILQIFQRYALIYFLTTSIFALKWYMYQFYFSIKQGSPVTIKSLYRITYVWKNFAVNQKAYIKRHTFYLVICLIIFRKLVLIYIKWNIANSAKINIEVWFKNIHTLTLRMYFKIYTVWRECKALFLVNFNITIS